MEPARKQTEPFTETDDYGQILCDELMLFSRAYVKRELRELFPEIKPFDLVERTEDGYTLAPESIIARDLQQAGLGWDDVILDITLIDPKRRLRYHRWASGFPHLLMMFKRVQEDKARIGFIPPPRYLSGMGPWLNRRRPARK